MWSEIEAYRDNPSRDPETALASNVIRGTLGVHTDSDQYQGCVRLRTLRSLLQIIDEETAFERSPHQQKFHEAFIRAAARIIYREEWPLKKDSIMRYNGWPTAKSEVLISTPRRFGKTFSVAMFIACIALTFPLEIVVFSPARRTSHKLLERIIEFVEHVGFKNWIVERNMENMRVRTLSNASKTSLVRSFPSNVGVRHHGNRTLIEPLARTPPRHGGMNGRLTRKIL